ncbi:MAG: hypothetical protein ACE364_05655 [Chlorobiota bacterium]
MITVLFAVIPDSLQSQTNFDLDKLTNTTTTDSIISTTFCCLPLWEYDRMNDKLIKEDIIIDSLYSQLLVNMVNKSTDPNKSIYSFNSSNDTLYIKIRQFKYKKIYEKVEPLEYLLTTTFTLTELSDIKYVSFEFDGKMEIYNRVLNRDKALGLKEEIKLLIKSQ